MAKKKNNTVLMVVGDSSSCSACKSAKALLEKNGRLIKKYGIDEVQFINPKDSEDDANLAKLYQKKHINGMEAQPLTVIVRGANDVAFLGFSKKKFLKNVKQGADEIKELSKPKKETPKKGFFAFLKRG